MRLTLPLGLVGLPGQTQFTLRSDASSGLVEMVAREPDGLDFVAAPIERIRPGLRDRLVAMGEAGAGDLVLILLAVHGEPPVLTANLAGPIIIEADEGIGRQLVLEGDDFPLRAEIAKLA